MRRVKKKILVKIEEKRKTRKSSEQLIGKTENQNSQKLVREDEQT